MMHNAIRQRRNMVSDEAEALQTDVMRFLAIICMCLMIVFSLVQSLPMSGEENRPRITTREMIQKEIESLKRKSDQLKQSLMALEYTVTLKKEKMQQLSARIAAQQNRIEHLDTATRKSVEAMTAARQTLSDINARVQQAMEKEQQFQTMVGKAEQSLVERQMALSRVNALVDKGRAALDAMESDLKEAKQALNQLASAPHQLNAQRGMDAQREVSPGAEQEKPVQKEETSKTEKMNAETKEIREKISTPSDGREGFTLGFDSDKVLLQLLHQENKVKLYMLSGGRCWQLKVGGSGRVSFLPSPSPGTIYEMDRRTVPDKIIRAGKLVVAAFGTEGVTYGVKLSSDIASRISDLMKEKKGGDLVILEKGEVTLE